MGMECAPLRAVTPELDRESTITWTFPHKRLKQLCVGSEGVSCTLRPTCHFDTSHCPYIFLGLTSMLMIFFCQLSISFKAQDK